MECYSKNKGGESRALYAHTAVREPMAIKPKMMLFSHISNTRSITGAEKLLLQFCKEISPYFECILVTPGEGRLTATARKLRISVQIQNIPMLHGMYTPYEGLEQDAEALRHHESYVPVLKMIKYARPDIVLVNTCINVLPAMAAKELGIPVIWKITEVMRQTGCNAYTVSIIDRYSDWVIGISNAVLAPLQSGGIPAKSGILPPSSEMDKTDWRERKLQRTRKREKLGLFPSHNCIGYISSFIYEAKGLLPFVEMALRLCVSHPGCRFWIIGTAADTDYYAKCRVAIRKSRYAKRFIFSTFEESVSFAYGAMDIVVIPSMIEEGFGLTALEGLVHGKPVVAFSQGGLAEMMEATGNADYLVEPGNSAMLAHKVAHLLDHPEEAERIGSRNCTEASRVYGGDAYRASIHAIILQWLVQYPGWFPLIQQESGPVYIWEQGSLRPVDIPASYVHKIRYFPASILNQLSVLQVPPIPYHEVESVTSDDSGTATPKRGRDISLRSKHKSRSRSKNRSKRRLCRSLLNRMAAKKSKKRRIRGKPTGLRPSSRRRHSRRGRSQKTTMTRR